MTIRRLATLCLLLTLNLILGIMYIQPSKILRFISDPVINDTLIDNSSFLPFVNHTTNNSFINEPIKINTPTQETAMFLKFTLNPRDLCSNTTSKLSCLILVCTAVPNTKQRVAIRETWGSSMAAYNVRLAFLLGSTHNSLLQEQIEKESSQYGDIIQQNFTDSYQNLTLKSIMLLKWVSDFCPNVQYVLKTDDDMYVNVANLLTMLVRVPVKTNVMYGVLFKKAKPNRNPSAKWFVPKNQFEGSMFPDYLSGTGYVMSRDVIPRLLEASTVLSFLVMEDVFITGLCASESHVRRFNVRGFAYWRRPATGCAFKDVITGHHVAPAEMRKIWKELQKKPVTCRQPKT